MELTSDDARSMIELALDRMLADARSLGDRVGERPAVGGANSLSGLIAHGIGVTYWWLAHEALGDPYERDRDAEFESTLGVAELESAVAELKAALPDLLTRIDDADHASAPKPAGIDPAWSWTPSGMVLHVLEELFQHAGHADATTDILLAKD